MEKPMPRGRQSTYQDRLSTFNNSVRDAIRRGAVETRCKNMKRSLQVLGDKWAHSDDDMKSGVKVMRGFHTQEMIWGIISKYVEGLAAEHLDWWQKILECVRARAEQGNINHPAYVTWTADFMLRQNESRAFLGKYLNDPHVPWKNKNRFVRDWIETKRAKNHDTLRDLKMRQSFEILEICEFWRENSNITHIRLEHIGYMYKPGVFSAKKKSGPFGPYCILYIRAKDILKTRVWKANEDQR